MTCKADNPANLSYTAPSNLATSQNHPIMSKATFDMPVMPPVQMHKRSESTSEQRHAPHRYNSTAPTRSPSSSYSRSVQSDTGSLWPTAKRVSFSSLSTSTRRRPHHYAGRNMPAPRTPRRLRPYASRSSETLSTSIPRELHQLYRSGRKSLTMPIPLHVLDRTSLHECAIAMDLPEPKYARDSNSASSYRDSVTNLSMTTDTSVASSITSLGNLSRQDLHAHLKEEIEGPSAPELELPLYNNGPTLQVGTWRLQLLRCLLFTGFVFPPLWLLGAIIGGRKNATYEEYRIRRYCRVALIVFCVVAVIAAITYLIVHGGALNSGTSRVGIHPFVNE